MWNNIPSLVSSSNPQTVEGMKGLLGVLLVAGGQPAAWMIVGALCIAIVLVAMGYAIRIAQNRP